MQLLCVIPSCLYLRTKSCYEWQFNLILQLLILDFQTFSACPGKVRTGGDAGHWSECSVLSPSVSIDHVQTTPVARGRFCVLTSLTRPSTLCLRLKAYVYVATGNAGPELHVAWKPDPFIFDCGDASDLGAPRKR